VIAFALLACATAPGAFAVEAGYPTDQCVSEKLRAAGRYCDLAVRAGGDESKLAGARKALAGAWSAAEARSAEAGVACDQTTVTAARMSELLDAGAAALVSSIDGEGTCRDRRVAAAGAACHALLDAEGQHLVLRSSDRERKILAKRQELAVAKLEASWATCGDGGEPPTEAVEGVVREAFLASVVSPNVSTEWTMIEPPAQVPYGDRVLEPICSRGTPWVYFAKRGTVNKLLVYYQGGGACWDYLTCQPFVQTFKSTAGPSDNPANATTGFADFTNPANPFKDWNIVFVPYCTGDVHWGDATVNHEFAGSTTLIHHKGRVNASVAEKFAREHFVSPDQVFVTGSSAGSYGAIVNGLFLQEHAYPSAPFAVVGDAGNGVITRDFLENDLAKWGIEENLPTWIPGLDVPLTELEASDLWTEAARFYPNSRWANYTTAYDGGTGGQVGFYNIMLSGDDLTQFVLWWRPSCEWNAEMRRLVQESAGAAPENYRYYIGVGSRHTMWGNNKVYTDTTGGVPTIVSWLNAMLDGTPDWTNVECADCGQLLPGDPRPNPAQPPYVEDPVTGQRVVCQ
jgi:hypothetical protein